MKRLPGLTADDRLDIHDLIARYQWSLDMGDEETFLGLFTPDGVIDFPTTGRFEGWEGIQRYWKFQYSAPTTKGRQHHVDSTWIEGGGTECFVRSYIFATLWIDAGGFSVFLASGYYEDKVVKIDDQWKFKERKFRVWSGDILSRYPALKPESIPQVDLDKLRAKLSNI